MTSENWPLSKLREGRVPVLNGAVTLGSFEQQDCSKLLQDRHENFVAILLPTRAEFDLWCRMPMNIQFLAAGAVRSVGMAIVARNSSVLSIEKLALILESVLPIGGDFPLRHRQRLPLYSNVATPLPEWLQIAIRSTANTSQGGTAECTAVAAGLHLLYDDLAGSHANSQSIEGHGKNHNGDYWHAIMHRREPDYGNAKYWFRRVGTHPVLAELPAVLNRVRTEAVSGELDCWADRFVKNGAWDPFAFVDACETASRPDAERVFVHALEEIQHFEMLHLLVQSFADADRK